MAKVDENPDAMPRPVQIACWLTGIWAVLLIVLLEGTQVCEGAEVADWWRFWARYLSCRDPNELGDFLSGAFAPLAFMWLVTTVFVQSEELKEQRRELQLTRSELELARGVAGEQRDAMKAQADEAKRSAEYLAVQASSLLEEGADRRAHLADAEIDQTLISLVGKSKSQELSIPISNPQKTAMAYKLYYTKGDEDIDDSIRHISMRAKIYMDAIKKGTYVPSYSETCATMADDLERIVTMAGVASKAQAIRLRSLPLKTIIEALRTSQSAGTD